MNEQVHHASTELYLLDNEPGAGRQQLLRTHRPPLGWLSESLGRLGLPEASRAVQAPCQDSVQQANRVAGISSARRMCQSQDLMTADNAPQARKFGKQVLG